jgi:hypothetical protein
MTHVRMAVPALAAAGVLALGGGSAWAFSNGHANPAPPGQARAIANCENQVTRQLTEGVSPSGGPKAGFAPLNCNHFFGAGGQPPE